MCQRYKLFGIIYSKFTYIYLYEYFTHYIFQVSKQEFKDLKLQTDCGINEDIAMNPKIETFEENREYKKPVRPCESRESRETPSEAKLMRSSISLYLAACRSKTQISHKKLNFS